VVVIRADKTARGDIRLKFFDTFGFKAVASIQELPPTLNGRCIRIQMQKAKRLVKRRIDEEWALSLRNKLLAYRFDRVCEPLPNDLNPLDVPDGRLVEIFTPLIASAPSDKVRSVIEELGKAQFEAMIQEERDTDEGQLFQVLAELLEEGSAQLGGFIATQAITNAFNESRDKREQISTKKCSNLMKRLGFPRDRDPQSGRMGFVLKRQVMMALAERYAIPIKDPEG